MKNSDSTQYLSMQSDPKNNLSFIDTEIENQNTNSKSQNEAFSPRNSRFSCISFSYNEREPYLVFILLGFLSLYNFNVLLYILKDISKYFANDSELTDYLILVLETFIISVVIFFTIKKGIRSIFLEISCYSSIFLPLMFPLVLQFMEHNILQMKILFYISMILIGIITGLLLGLSFSLASMMKINYASYMGFGQGAVGLILVIFYMICSKIFPVTKENILESKLNLKNLTWIFFSFGSLFSFIIGLLFSRLSYQQWFKERIAEYWVNKKTLDSSNNITSIYKFDFIDKNSNSHCTSIPNENVKIISEKNQFINDISTSASSKSTSTFPLSNDESKNLNSTNLRLFRKHLKLLKQSWMLFFSSFTNQWLTLFLFPLIGPYSWNTSMLYIAVFQFFDFTGRFLPLVVKLRLSNFSIFLFTCLRFIFIPLFTFSLVFVYEEFFNNNVYYFLMMSLLALTNGLINTQTLIKIPYSYVSVKEKALVGIYNILFVQISVITGLYASKGYKLILNLFI